MTFDSQATNAPGNEAAHDQKVARNQAAVRNQTAVWDDGIAATGNSRVQRQHYEVIKGNPDNLALRALDEVFQSVADRAAEVQAGKKPNTRGRYGLPTPSQRGRTGAPLHPNPASFRNP